MRTGRIAPAAALAALAALAIAAPSAQAKIESVFDGRVQCEEQPDGTRWCGGYGTTVPTFDGLGIDVNVALPPAPRKGPDGPYPLVMVFHGYGGGEFGLQTLERWTKKGYAAFTMSDRGFHGSCGEEEDRLDPACRDGHIRLMDTRYEVRDAQTFAGMLVDEGIADRRAIGATGGSYGGGMSMALAALKNRVMLPDGSLTRWTSPKGKPMRIAAAAPDIPWTDLAYSLMPNGRTLDYVADAPYGETIGVMKLSFVTGLFVSGEIGGNYAPPLADPDADLVTWFARINLGEPYQGSLVSDLVEEIAEHHSSYYIDDSIRPAPLFISNGWTDDLFPPDEAIRFYNRTRTRHPNAKISLFFSDHGHQRGQKKEEDADLLKRRQNRWFAHYLQGRGRPPREQVEVLTQTCPKDAPSGGPYRAPSWAKIARGEVRLRDAAAQTMTAIVLDTAGIKFDPIGGNDACVRPKARPAGGSVNYDFPPAPNGGYTLLGSPTLIADIDSPGPHSQISARLLDVGADGKETLVARGLWRPEQGSARQVFQLHPNAYKFAGGHFARLQLLPADVPYARLTNGQGPVTFSNAEVRLPVRERAGARGGKVKRVAPKVVPSGLRLARGYGGR